MNRLTKQASAVKALHAEHLFRLPAVVGHGVGLSKEPPRKPIIEVYVSHRLTDSERDAFPKELDGVPVEIVVTGPIRTLPKQEESRKTGSDSKDSEVDSGARSQQQGERPKK